MKRAKEKDKRVTIVDVAKLAQVSISTASRVFDSKWEGKIRPATRQAVLDAAQSLGYYGTSALVRGLNGQHTNIIALVVGSTTGYFYQDVIMKFVRKIQSMGKQVLIFEANPEVGMEGIVAQVHQYRVDGIIITAAATSSSIIDSFCNTEAPAIVFNRMVRDTNVSAVYCDGREAAKKAADFLMAQGHRRFAVISGDSNVCKELGRVEGFQERVLSCGGVITASLAGDYKYESGYELAGKFLSHEVPDAVFCAEDTIAMGVMDAAREQFGLRVPEDLSVMGFDNSSVSRFHAYSLTTVQHPVNEMINATVEMLEHLLEYPGGHLEKVMDTEIIIRSSVKVKE